MRSTSTIAVDGHACRLLSSWSASRSSSRSTHRSSRLGARMCKSAGTDKSVAPQLRRPLRRRGHAHPNFRRCAREYGSKGSGRAATPGAGVPHRGLRSPAATSADAIDAIELESEIAKRRANFVRHDRVGLRDALPHGATPPPGALARASRSHPIARRLHKPRRPTRGGGGRHGGGGSAPLSILTAAAAPHNTHRRVQGVVVAQRGGRLRARRDARRRRVQRGAPRPPPEDGQAGGGEGDPARAAVGGEHPPRGGRAAPRRDAPRDREARGLLRVADAPLHRDGVRRRRRALRPPGDGGRVLGEGRGGAPPAARGRGGAAPRAEAVPRRHQAREFALRRATASSSSSTLGSPRR